MSVLYIAPNADFRDDVKRAYEKYVDRISRGTLMMLSPPGGERKYYVYEWFTRDSGKVFYVGKGTRSRYRHILYDMKRPRGAEYKELQDAFGIDCCFLAKGLTSREAEIYKLCMVIERTDAGEVLLQYANNPGVTAYWDRIEKIKTACANRTFTPEILVSDYRRRYFGVVPPAYDLFDMSRLHVTLHASFSQSSPDTIQEMGELRDLITSAGGRVYAKIAKGTQAVIELDCMDYDKYMQYKSAGLMVYHAFDVMQQLRE